MKQPQKPARLYREMRMEVMPPDEEPAEDASGTEQPEDERISVAISSEASVERMDWRTGDTYLEVLGHGEGEVDLSYARDGLPFLLDHNGRVQVGLIEDVTLDADRRIRGKIRAGNHPDAGWAFKDIKAGIRTKVSVGYDPGDQYDQSEDEQGRTVRRYRGWLPMEASSVSIPADYNNAGIGREATPGARPAEPITPAVADQAEERTMSKSEEPTAGPTAAEQREKDLKGIAAVARSFPDEARELLPTWLERGVGADVALAEVEAERKKRAADPMPAGHLDLSDKDRRDYNLAGAILARADAMRGKVISREDSLAVGLVEEADAAIRSRLEKEGNARKASTGIMVPMDMRIDMRSVSEGQRIAAALGQRASVTGNVAGTTSLGGAGVQTTIVGFVDLLRARTRVFQLGARFMPGLTDTIAFVRQLTANTFSFPGENPSTEMSLTAATIEQFTMSPKIGMAGTSYSRRMLAQGNASFDVNSFVMNDLNAIIAIGIDYNAVSGPGTNAPTGIRGTTNVQNKTLGAAGAALAWADLVAIETLIGTANADIGTIGTLTNPNVKGKLKTTLKNTTAGSAYLWESGPNFNGQMADTLNGYNAQVSTSIPNNLTKGTSTTVCSALVFGVWDQCVVGEWGGAAELLVNPYTYSKQNVIEVTATLGIDVGVLQPTAFVKIEDILTA